MIKIKLIIKFDFQESVYSVLYKLSLFNWKAM